MCGIAGIISSQVSDKQIIRNMTTALAHRGPDASGYFDSPHVQLGHRRLSIIDLNSRANQPFYSQSKRYVIVFNGEIYNFKSIASRLQQEGVALHTTSDTEIILEAFERWGVGFVQMLVGMFAIAIYDTQAHELFLFRDRIGKKPLFYYWHNGLFAFASEIKALWHHPEISAHSGVRHATVSAFLQLGYIQQPNTFYHNISKFPAGHYGILKGNSFSVLPYWTVSHHLKTNRQSNEATAQKELKSLLEQAVHDRLIADVPLGIFLSGGVDSSSVTAVASKTGRIKTFSIGFKEAQFDESEYAKQIATHLGTEHHAYMLTEQDAAETLETYLHHFDEPFADTSSIPTLLVSKCARQQVTVALTGDGGDELFLGYGAYPWANRLANPVVKFARPFAHQILQRIPASRWKRIANLFMQVRPDRMRRHIFSQEQYFFSERELQSLVFLDRTYFHDWDYDDFRYLKTLSEAERQALFDIQLYLRDDLLVKVDRASMYFGLECRSPLLDHRLVEFAINLPEQLKLRNMTSKYLLKKVLAEYLPARYFDRPKRGFSVPMAQWLKRDMNYLLDYLSEENLARTSIFNSTDIRDLVARFMKGEEYLYNRLWVLIVAQRFILQHGKQ